MSNSALLISVLGLTLLCVEFTSALRFRDCGSKADKSSINVSISGCEENTRKCQVKRGENASIEVKFKTLDTYKGSKALNVRVYGNVLGLRVPFPLPDSDGCGRASGIRCPIEEKNDYTYGLTMPIQSFYPPIELVVELLLKDDNDDEDAKANTPVNSLVCVAFPLQIV